MTNPSNTIHQMMVSMHGRKVIEGACHYARKELEHLSPSQPACMLVYAIEQLENTQVHFAHIPTECVRDRDGGYNHAACMANLGGETKAVHDLLGNGTSGKVWAVVYVPDSDPSYESLKQRLQDDFKDEKTDPELLKHLDAVCEFYGHTAVGVGYGIDIPGTTECHHGMSVRTNAFPKRDMPGM